MVNAARPSVEEFRNRAREEFAFLEREFGFREEPIPTQENPHLNECAVWFTTAMTRVVVEGIHWGLSTRVALGSGAVVTAFENYDLDDLVTIRRPEAAASKTGVGQVEQLRLCALLLRDVAADVLRGDHSVFVELDAIVQRRRKVFAAERKPGAPPA